MNLEVLIIPLILAIVPTITTTWIIGKMNKKEKEDRDMATRLTELEATKEANRKKEGVLILKNLDAIGTLSEITALCYKHDRKPNGELDTAIKARQEAKQAFRDHLYEEHEQNK